MKFLLSVTVMYNLKPIMMASGGKDVPAASPIEEAEIDIIRKRLSRRLREPDFVSSVPAKQQECKKLDLHTLRKRLSKKLKKIRSL